MVYPYHPISYFYPLLPYISIDSHGTFLKIVHYFVHTTYLMGRSKLMIYLEISKVLSIPPHNSFYPSLPYIHIDSHKSFLIIVHYFEHTTYSMGRSKFMIFLKISHFFSISPHNLYYPALPYIPIDSHKIFLMIFYFYFGHTRYSMGRSKFIILLDLSQVYPFYSIG